MNMKNGSRYTVPISSHHVSAGGISTTLTALLLVFAIANVAVADEFMITPGDELRIFIPGLRPPEQLYVVDTDGNIDLGIQGRVKVSGYPVNKAQELIKTHLERYLKSVEGVTLLIKRSRRTVFVTGCVAEPGVITIEANVDLWQALHQAGGVTACADLTRVLFLRDGLTLPVDVRAYLTRDVSEPLPRLRAGDTVFVPAEPGLPLGSGEIAAPFLGAEALNRKVFVIGSVVSPGMYDRTDEMDALTAVSLADGPTPEADLGNTVVLTKEQSIKVDLNAALQGTKLAKNLLPGNGGAIIYVPTLHENMDTRLGAHINVIGPFERTGRIPVSGPIKLIDVVGIVGGDESDGKLHQLSVIQDAPGFTLTSKYDLEEYLEKGGWVGRVPVYPGSTVVIGRRDLVAYQETLRTLTTMAMLSTSVAIWINLAQ